MERITTRESVRSRIISRVSFEKLCKLSRDIESAKGVTAGIDWR